MKKIKLYIADGIELTKPQEKILKGALGLQYAEKPYRNHYLAPESGEIRDLCEEMADLGLISAGAVQKNSKTKYFFVTEAGAKVLGHELPED